MASLDAGVETLAAVASEVQAMVVSRPEYAGEEVILAPFSTSTGEKIGKVVRWSIL